jgi:predicted transposase/invertase (TIGR01784 family)
MNYKDLAETVKYYKEDNGGYNMCKLMEDYTEKKSRMAEQRGEQRGEEKGIQKGKIEGKKEGMLEGKKETARKMIAKGMDFSEIAELVGLSVEQVKQLAKENK